MHYAMPGSHFLLRPGFGAGVGMVSPWRQILFDGTALQLRDDVTVGASGRDEIGPSWLLLSINLLQKSG
jgi:hypothetical protein